jgi:hypothetical protein
MNEEKDKLNIWWKLGIASAIISFVSYPAWFLFHWSDKIFPSSDKLATILAPYAYIIVVCFWLSGFAVAFFSVFCIWHWRTRYAGRNHIVWPIITVLAYWPAFINPLPASFFVAIVYFFVHILPDIRRRGTYANPAITAIEPPATPLPKQYKLAKSACFTIGWSLIILSLIVSIIALIASFVILNILARRLPKLVGENITKQISSALVLSTDVSKTCIVTNFLCAITAAIGAIFIQVSQRLRWRLLDEEDKKELKKNI